MNHISQHAQSHLAGHTFLGHARPRPNNTPQPDLGLIERSARRSKPMRAGVWAHRPLHTCTLRGRPEAELAPLIQEQAYVPIRRAPLSRWRHEVLRLIPRRRVPITFPRSWLVRIDQMARLRSNTQNSLSVLFICERRPGPGPPLT